MNTKQLFSGKKITQMGLGLLGRGVGDAVFLAESGADLIVTDLKDEESLRPSVDALKKFPNVTLVLGEHRLEDFHDCDLVLFGPKTPTDNPYTKEARSRGIHTTMSTALFAKHAGLPIIGVTGTRGKSTVSYMIQHILERSGEKVLLGGNIRGMSTLAELARVEEYTVAVLELDSWQLQGFREEGISPHIAVFTTFFPDHQDYYASMESYLADKAEIFLHQNEKDTLILGEQVAPMVKDVYEKDIKGECFIVGDDQLPATLTLLTPGVHNRYNAAIAASVARAYGVNEDILVSALKTFKGVPGRLERIGEYDGITYYNDTTATTPEATIAALRALTKSAHPEEALEEEKHTILIMGGSDKGLALDGLIKEAEARTKEIIFLAGSGTNRLQGAFPGARVCDSLKEAVESARGYARAGDSILLSPAFASFGMFQNEYDRGDQFNGIIASMHHVT